jgi:hypothetical protein
LNPRRFEIEKQLGFDRYQRFKATADLIEDLAGTQRLHILDVGSHDDSFSPFLPRHRVRPWSGLVLSSNGGLPLADKEVDVSVALDVLEHIPPPERAFFIGELARVSRRACIFAFPIAGAAPVEEFVLHLTGSKWLAEHKEHGLPDPGEIEIIFKKLGLKFARHPNASLASWMAMMLLMYGVQDEATRGEISNFFSRHFYQVENREPVYRYIYVCQAAPG